MPITTEWVAVTPQLANSWLQKNKSNRPLSRHAVADIAERMKNGIWIETHQGLAFDSDGNLIDGQHRLSAISKSGITHRYSVSHGLSPEAFDHTDIGGKGSRTASDLLARRVPSLTNRTLLCGAAAAALRGMRGPSKVDRLITVDFVEQHHTLMTPFVAELKKVAVCSSPLVGAFIAGARVAKRDTFIGPKGGRDMNDLLFCARRLREMEWTGPSDPMKALFTRLLREKENEDHIVEQTKVYTLTVAALRASLAGRALLKSASTEIDWGDAGDHVKAGSDAHKAKMAARPARRPA